jgi:predicted secreted protein with PEFG-CTERM motif
LKEGIFFVFGVLMCVSLFSSVYAESSYDILIPSGSADPNAPFHWSSEKDGDASGYIQIIVQDTVVWKNADTVEHTVTSGTPEGGPDGLFDSGNFEEGDQFSYKFMEVGKYPYYCTLHPWRTGLVDVLSGFAVLPKVASDVGDGSKTFDLEYKFNRLLRTASVSEETKSILFTLQGNTNSDDNTLTLLLPSELISGVSSVSIDGAETENFSQELENGLARLVIKEIPPQAKEITITGATIIPEFGAIAVLILAIAIISIIAISEKSKLNLTHRL